MSSPNARLVLARELPLQTNLSFSARYETFKCEADLDQSFPISPGSHHGGIGIDTIGDGRQDDPAHKSHNDF